MNDTEELNSVIQNTYTSMCKQLDITPAEIALYYCRPDRVMYPQQFNDTVVWKFRFFARTYAGRVAYMDVHLFSKECPIAIEVWNG